MNLEEEGRKRWVDENMKINKRDIVGHVYAMTIFLFFSDDVVQSLSYVRPKGYPLCFESASSSRPFFSAMQSLKLIERLWKCWMGCWVCCDTYWIRPCPSDLVSIKMYCFGRLSLDSVTDTVWGWLEPLGHDLSKSAAAYVINAMMSSIMSELWRFASSLLGRKSRQLVSHSRLEPNLYLYACGCGGVYMSVRNELCRDQPTIEGNLEDSSFLQEMRWAILGVWRQRARSGLRARTKTACRSAGWWLCCRSSFLRSSLL